MVSVAKTAPNIQVSGHVSGIKKDRNSRYFSQVSIFFQGNLSFDDIDYLVSLSSIGLMVPLRKDKAPFLRVPGYACISKISRSTAAIFILLIVLFDFNAQESRKNNNQSYGGNGQADGINRVAKPELQFGKA